MDARKTSRVVVAAAAVVGALVASAPAFADPPPRPTTDPKETTFIKQPVDAGVPYTSAPRAIALAQTTCGILGTSSPTKLTDAATTIENSVPMRPDQMQKFAFAAVGAYCPKVDLS